MVNAAAYIYKKVKEEHLLTKAFNWDKERGTHNFQGPMLKTIFQYKDRSNEDFKEYILCYALVSSILIGWNFTA